MIPSENARISSCKYSKAFDVQHLRHVDRLVAVGAGVASPVIGEGKNDIWAHSLLHKSEIGVTAIRIAVADGLYERVRRLGVC